MVGGGTGCDGDKGPGGEAWVWRYSKTGEPQLRVRIEIEDVLTLFWWVLLKDPLPASLVPFQRMAGTAGAHQGKEKGDPSSEPSV